MSILNENCVCDTPGFCDKMKRRVSAGMIAICNGSRRFSKNKRNQCLAYWMGQEQPTIVEEEDARESYLGCVHRSDVHIKTEDCKTCSGRVRVKVFGCELYGSCSLSKRIGYQTCNTCLDYEAGPEKMRENNSCVYLKDKLVDKISSDGSQLYGCHVYEKCTVDKESPEYPSCLSCSKKILRSDRDFSSKFEDQLNIVDRTRSKTHSLRNMLSGRPSFLVCGGPSARSLDLQRIQGRGVWSMAVNNMAGYFHPSSFVCSDPPSKFHHGIWLDPNTMKFIPIPKFSGGRANLREKLADGTFIPLERDGKNITTREALNTWGFERRSWLKTDESFFVEPSAAWGNHAAGVQRTGEKKTVCTMMLAIRLLYYLGSRTIFLVGVDFWMDPTADLKDNYAFGEHREKGAVQSNNSQFSIVNEWLVKMQNDRVFEKFGLEIYNCNPQSGLRAFPHVPYDQAVEVALEGYPKEPFSLEGWYIK